MEIRIYINEKDKIMCHIPGEPKDMLFIEFAMGVGLGNADKIKERLGEEMPELVVDCEFNPAIKDHYTCILLIDQIRTELEKKYKK